MERITRTYRAFPVNSSPMGGGRKIPEKERTAFLRKNAVLSYRANRLKSFYLTQSTKVNTLWILWYFTGGKNVYQMEGITRAYRAFPIDCPSMGGGRKFSRKEKTGAESYSVVPRRSGNVDSSTE